MFNGMSHPFEFCPLLLTLWQYDKNVADTLWVSSPNVFVLKALLSLLTWVEINNLSDTSHLQWSHVIGCNNPDKIYQDKWF